MWQLDFESGPALLAHSPGDGNLLRVDSATGKILWRVHVGPAVTLNGTVHQPDGNLAIDLQTETGQRRVDPTTGRN